MMGREAVAPEAVADPAEDRRQTARPRRMIIRRERLAAHRAHDRLLNQLGRSIGATHADRVRAAAASGADAVALSLPAPRVAGHLPAAERGGELGNRRDVRRPQVKDAGGFLPIGDSSLTPY